MFLCCCFLPPLPLDCVLCPPAWMPLLTFTPTAVRPSRAFSSAITAAMLTFGTAGWQSDVDASVSAVNKTPGRRTLLQAVSVQSINFQDKHQKEKILFFPPRCLCREIVLFAEADAQSPVLFGGRLTLCLTPRLNHRGKFPHLLCC